MVTSLFIDFLIVSVIVINVFIIVAIVQSLIYCPLNSASLHLVTLWIQQVIIVIITVVELVDSRFVYISGISHPHIRYLTHRYPMDGQLQYVSLTSSPILILNAVILIVLIFIILMVITCIIVNPFKFL